MLRIIPAFLVMVMALTASACATIVDGTSQLVTFNSEPSRGDTPYHPGEACQEHDDCGEKGRI